MKKLTQEDFVEKVKLIHGDRFDLSQLRYVNYKTDVNVICPEHGLFTIQPVKLLKNQNPCPICNEEYHLSTTERFVEKLRSKFGDKFDYSQVVYCGSNEKIAIVCPEHGVIEKTASSALNCKHLCNKCFHKHLSELYVLPIDEFITKSREVHGDKYDYSKVKYENSKEKVCIICPKHGEFWQEPSLHMRGEGCKKCRDEKNAMGLEEFIRRSKEKHGNRFDYSKTRYINSGTKVCIVDTLTGIEFWQTPENHLQNSIPRECRKAERFIKSTKKKKKIRLTQEIVLSRLRETFGDKYDYSKVVYVNSQEKLTLTCPIHGDFKKSVNHALRGQGCPECSKRNGALKHVSSTDEFVQKAKQIHGDKYDYSKVEYEKARDKICIICPKHGEFWQTPNKHLMGQGCEKCTTPISKWEVQVNNFIKSLGIQTVQSDKTILTKQLEIDIVIPDLKIGIECDGLWWHSDEFKSPTFHLEKTIACEDKGIRLIHIFEDEWLWKQDIVKSILRYVCNKVDKRIYARQCRVERVSHNDAKMFLNENHIQGACIHEVALGLYFNDELVSIMTFGKERRNLGSKNTNNADKELLRFCNKLNTVVVGGAQKLFQYYIKNFDFRGIKSYCDRRWFSGEIYEQLGFEMKHVSQPNYYYIVHNRRENRFKYRKDRLVSEGFDPNKTEREIMKERNIHRIYDCGNKVYFFKKKQ